MKIIKYINNLKYDVLTDHKTLNKIGDILLYDLGFSDEIKNTLSIINFNYTNFIDIAIKEILKFHLLNFELNDMNKHGDVEEPIFGVDSKYNNNPNLIKFTKTSRLSGNWTIHDQWKLPESKHLKNINFFGHSLSKADYSYFQSIFDYCSI